MKMMRAVSLAIAVVLLAVAVGLHLDGKWGHLPTVVGMASAMYWIICFGFHLAVYKRKSGNDTPA